jgi:uncharacterized protein
MLINVTVTARASKDEVIVVSDNIFKVKVTAVPVKGQANQRVIELLSKHFKVPKSQIEIKAGKTAKEKLVQIK